MISILLVTLAVPAGAQAADEAWEDDPLGLIAFREEVSSLYTIGQDSWEVWVCELDDGSVPIDLSETVTLLDTEIGPYFLTLSGGVYRPVFKVGGVVTSPFSEPSQTGGDWFLDDCERRVAAATTGSAAAALIVANTDYLGGYGTIGSTCPGFYPGYPYSCPTNYPDNGRVAVVGGGTVVSVPPLDYPRLKLNYVSQN